MGMWDAAASMADGMEEFLLFSPQYKIYPSPSVSTVARAVAIPPSLPWAGAAAAVRPLCPLPLVFFQSPSARVTFHGWIWDYISVFPSQSPQTHFIPSKVVMAFRIPLTFCPPATEGHFSPSAWHLPELHPQLAQPPRAASDTPGFSLPWSSARVLPSLCRVLPATSGMASSRSSFKLLLKMTPQKGLLCLQAFTCLHTQGLGQTCDIVVA